MVSMRHLETSTCKGCGEPIRWMTNDNTDRKAPIHAKPVDGGNVVLHDHQHFHVLTKDEQLALDEYKMSPYHGADRYMFHFALCTDAKVYKRRDPISRQTQ